MGAKLNNHLTAAGLEPSFNDLIFRLFQISHITLLEGSFFPLPRYLANVMQHKGIYTLHLGFLHIEKTHLLLNEKETLNNTSLMLLNTRPN